jgi:GNAT superfamily N-acetyltransferase
MKIEIVPFTPELLPQAGELLAARHRETRRTFPQLPARYEETGPAARAVEAVWKREGSAGFAAFTDSRMTAFLIGDAVNDPGWGSSGWIRPAGWACTTGLAGTSGMGNELLRDLYACLGKVWLEKGILTHLVFTPVLNPDLIDIWFSLSFGIEQIHGIADMENPEWVSSERGSKNRENSAEIEIRRARPGDSGQLVEMSDIIWKTQIETPVWAQVPPEYPAQIEEGWAELPEDKELTVWLALEKEKLAGIHVYMPADRSGENIMIPENCCHLVVAATREKERGRGISSMLLKRGFEEAMHQGFKYCETDWRSTNLLSSRHWPRKGFHPVLYRLVRRVDPRIISETEYQLSYL